MSSGRAMRESTARTKVVVRHLPPSLSEAAFMEHIQSRFADLYDWASFFPGTPGTFMHNFEATKFGRCIFKNKILTEDQANKTFEAILQSHKFSLYSRAHIHFKQPEYVLTFYELFDGHNFVNEKGLQYKAVVEFSPYQRIPKLWLKKDVREGTIMKDPEYTEFLEHLAKPVEYLPSAEVQLDRREAERAAGLGGGKDSIIVTPLMEFIRQKRALKSTQRPLSISAKLNSRAGAHATTAILSRRSVDRSRTVSNHLPSPTAGRQKEKSAYIPRREDSQCQDHELLIEKKKEKFEILGKKIVREICSPRISTNNQPDTPEKSSDVNLKQNPVVLTDSVAEPTTSNEVQNLDSCHGSGKVSSDICETSDLSRDVYEYEVTKKRQMEREKLVLNDAIVEDSSTSTAGGKFILKNQVAPSGKLISGLHPSSTKQQGARLPGRVYTVASAYKAQRKEAAIKSKQMAPSLTQAQSQSDPYVEKRPPRLQNFKASTYIHSREAETGASQSDAVAKSLLEGKSSGASTNNPFISATASEKEGRRLRNKDRPDRPVWTVRCRSEANSHSSGISVSKEGGDRGPAQNMGQSVMHGEVTADLSQQEHASQKDGKNEFIKVQGTNRSATIEAVGEEGSVQISSSAECQGQVFESQTFWNDIGANYRQARRDRGINDTESTVASSESSKPSRRSTGQAVYGGHEKQVWVAKSGTAS